MKHLHLPSTAALALVLGWGGLASAETTLHERVVHETTTSMEIEVTNETVLCSAADYSFFALKILIPELAALTLLDHQNFGAGAPCVAAGQCGLPGGHEPGDILNDYDLLEEVDIVVKAIRVDIVDDVALTCLTSLTERVDVEVRGVPFFHERYADLGSRPYADCAPPPPAEEPGSEYPGEDGEDEGGNDSNPGDSNDSANQPKSDYYYDRGRESDSGGCSAVGTPSTSGLLILLGVALLGVGGRRRRKH